MGVQSGSKATITPSIWEKLEPASGATIPAIISSNQRDTLERYTSKAPAPRSCIDSSRAPPGRCCSTVYYSALFTFFSSAQIHNTLFAGIYTSLTRAGASSLYVSINGLLFQYNSMTRPPYIQLATGWEDVRCSAVLVLPHPPLYISYGPAHDSWISFFLPGRSLKPLCLMKSCLSTFSFFPSSVLLERHLMEDSLRARYKNKFENENEWTRNRRDHVWFVFCP